MLPLELICSMTFSWYWHLLQFTHSGINSTCTLKIIITDITNHDTEEEEGGVNSCSLTMQSKTLSNFQTDSLIQQCKHKQISKRMPKQPFLNIKFWFMCLSSTKTNVHFLLTHLYTYYNPYQETNIFSEMYNYPDAEKCKFPLCEDILTKYHAKLRNTKLHKNGIWLHTY